jgi:cob(I)alamin adenosyltransferase
MTISRSRDLRELCYPYIFESQLLCDYEILTDELCCQIGAVLPYLSEEESMVREDLLKLQPLIYHLNGSIRGNNGIFEEDLAWVKARYDYYLQESGERVKGFVLPQGPLPVPQLHLCRCNGKKIVRMLVRLDEAGVVFPPELPRFANLLANFFFVLTVYLKARRDVPEVPYVSINYPKKRE